MEKIVNAEKLVAQQDQDKQEIKILLVDDREDNLFAIEAILEKDNYIFVKANSGREALKVLLQQQDFSLILMDVQMPELNGFETATIIYQRDRLKEIPIIFITAFSHDEDYVFKGYETGGVDYIYKPINPELLRMKVSVFVDLYRKNQQLLQHERKLLAANKSLQKEVEDRMASEKKVKLLNEQLVQNNIHLKTINEELDQFAYIASHDLQEPLRKIMVFSDKILITGGLNNDTERYFNKIIAASKRMQLLINDLLTFSRQSTTSSDFIEVDLTLLAKEALTEMEIQVEKSNAQVLINELPVICAVPSLIRQLFYNLFTNAVKFRKKDVAPIVEVRAERVENINGSLPFSFHGDKYFKITVRDNGIGFDPKYANDIFVVFKRLHSYHEFEGSGVGLSICKKIVEKHHGLISVESQPGIGSTFTIVLPEQQSPQ